MPNQIENEIRELWSDVLQASDLAIDRDFLDLGGDSLAAMLCISRMRSKFGVELSIEDFLVGGATIEQLAALVRDLKSSSVD